MVNFNGKNSIFINLSFKLDFSFTYLYFSIVTRWSFYVSVSSHTTYTMYDVRRWAEIIHLRNKSYSFNYRSILNIYLYMCKLLINSARDDIDNSD